MLKVPISPGLVLSVPMADIVYYVSVTYLEYEAGVSTMHTFQQLGDNEQNILRKHAQAIVYIVLSSLKPNFLIIKIILGVYVNRIVV